MKIPFLFLFILITTSCNLTVLGREEQLLLTPYYLETEYRAVTIPYGEMKAVPLYYSVPEPGVYELSLRALTDQTPAELQEHIRIILINELTDSSSLYKGTVSGSLLVFRFFLSSSSSTKISAFTRDYSQLCRVEIKLSP